MTRVDTRRPYPRWLTAVRGRWATAIGSAVPLAAGVPFALTDPDSNLAAGLLLLCVLVGTLIGGVAAGGVAVVLSVFFLVQFAHPVARPPELALFVIAGGCVVGLVVWLRSTWSYAERSRSRGEVRVRELTEQLGVVEPVLAGAPVGFALLDPQMRYVYVNAAMSENYGRAVADFIGRRPGEVMPSTIAEQVEQGVRWVITTGRVQHIEQTAPGPDGSDQHHLVNRYPIRRADGGLVGVAVTVLDVTERVRLNRDLARTAAELDAMVQSSPLGVGLLDTQLRYKRINHALAGLCGLAPAKLLGRDVSAGLPLPADLVADFRRVLASGVGVQDRDVTITTPTGRTAQLQASYYPVRLPRGDTVGLAVVVGDVTEQHRLADLEAEATRLRATAELVVKLEEAQRIAGFGSWEWDLPTGRIAISRQLGQILGIDGPPASVADAVRFVHPEDSERARALMRVLLDEARPFVAELRLVRPDGRVIEVIGSGEALRDADGRIATVWGTIQDVTEQHEATRATRAAEQRARAARAALEAERQVLQMFQKANLPAELPVVPGIDLAAAYLPVAERLDIGGDWYDAFALPDGRLAIAVGDVTGHDLRAATIMGQVRNAVRAYAIGDASPGLVMQQVNGLLAAMPDLDLVTMLFGVYEPDTHTLTWSRGGHPAPVLRRHPVRRREAEVTTLDEPAGMLLGVVPADEPYPEGSLELGPGDAILWYTDGLVERRGADLEDALAQLADLVRVEGAADDADKLVNAVAAGMFSDGAQEDDVCLLALHRPRRPGS